VVRRPAACYAESITQGLLMTDPDQTFRALHARLAAAAGARLFTVTRIDRQAGLARRIYTSHPVDYPLSGTKPLQDDVWTDLVITRQTPFAANTTAEFAVFFPDHALINRLGCQSALNLPVVDGGQTLATVNVLDDAGRFTPATVAAVEAVLKRDHAGIVAAVLASPL
jgi:GAF domain-containing protein